MKPFIKKWLMSPGNLHGSYEWTTPGTYTFKLSARTKATVYMVGGGGDRQAMSLPGGTFWSAGGGGAAFVGGVILPAGQYSVNVGRARLNNITDTVLSHTSQGALITCCSAGHNNKGTDFMGNAGILIESSNLVVQVGTIQIESDGNEITYNGTITVPGASLYLGYGKGSDQNVSNPTDGYFKIEY